MVVDLFVVSANTTYHLAIHRALKPQDQLKIFQIQDMQEPEEGTLTEDDL
jgi:hypothetical protein